MAGVSNCFVNKIIS